MAHVNTSCGLVVLDKLQTANKLNAAYGGWCIILRYDGKKEPIQLTCSNEVEADKCLSEISNALDKLNKPLEIKRG